MLRLNSKGFGGPYLLLAIVVIAGIVAAGFMVYRANQEPKKPNSSTPSANTNQPAQTTSNTPQDPYADWKTYCDDIYRYCFKYPADWVTVSQNAATRVGASGQVTIANPAKTVGVTYVNSYTRDSAVITVNVRDVEALGSANQDLTLLGGYYATSGVVGNFAPFYRVVDTSLLSTYPLVKGQSGRFPSTARFTNKGTGSSTYSGTFEATPMVSTDTEADAQAWFDSADTKTSVLILKSFYYQ